MKRLLLSLLFVGIFTNVSHALTEEQIAALSYVGQVSAYEQVCSRIKVNLENVDRIIMINGLDLNDPLQNALAKSEAEEVIAAGRRRGEEAACASAMVIYGPMGSNVPGLLSWK